MYPLWIESNTLTFKGTRLRSTKIGSENNWQLPALPWGYADNHANGADLEKVGFNIEWAVDDAGNPVHLETIDFIRIHTAQVQEAGWLGETSTEVAGIIDLHPDAVPSSTKKLHSAENLHIALSGDLLFVDISQGVNQVSVYNMQGVQVAFDKSNHLNVAHLQKGVYILKVETVDGKSLSTRFIK